MISNYNILCKNIMLLSKKIGSHNGGSMDLSNEALKIVKKFAAIYPIKSISTVDLARASIYFASEKLDLSLNPLQINEICGDVYNISWLNTVNLMKKFLK